MKPLTRVLSVLTVAIFAFALCACGSSSSSKETAAAGSEVVAQPAEKQEEQAPESKYEVTIDKAEVVSDYKDNPAVAITYTFTNNSDETTSMATSVRGSVFQNGVECETAISSDIDTSGYSADLRPGASTEVNLVYSIADMSEIEVEVTELFSFDDTVLAYEKFTLE